MKTKSVFYRLFLVSLLFPLILSCSKEASNEPTTVKMTTYTGTGAYPQDIAFDGTSMWTVNWDDNSVTKITVR